MKIRYDQDAKACYIQLMPDLPDGEYIDYTHETPDHNVLVDIKDGQAFGVSLLNIPPIVALIGEGDER